MLSGFLITGILRRGPMELRRLPKFWFARLRRLWPAQAAMLVGVLIIIAAAYPRSLGDMSRWSVDSMLFVTDVMRAQGFNPPMIGHTWTLAVEMQLYFVWPFVLLAVNRVPHPGIVLALFGAGACALTMVLPFHVAEITPWAFVVGASLSYLTPSAPRWLVASLSWPPLATMGLLSYGIYLWHPAVIQVLDGQPWFVQLPVSVAVSTLLAALSYLTIERWAGCAKAPLWPRRASAPGLTEAAA